MPATTIERVFVSSDRPQTIKNAVTPPQGLSAAAGGSYRHYTRDELGAAFAEAAREAHVVKAALRTGRATFTWWSHGAVPQLLDELSYRQLEQCREREQYDVTLLH